MFLCFLQHVIHQRRQVESKIDCFMPDVAFTTPKSQTNQLWDQELIKSYGQGIGLVVLVVQLRALPILRAKFKHGVQCYYVYNWLHHSYMQQGYTEWAATPSSCVKVAKLLR